MLSIAHELPATRGSDQKSYEVTQLVEERIWDNGKRELTLSTSSAATNEWGNSGSNSAVTAVGTINYSLEYTGLSTPLNVKFNYSKGEIISRGGYPSYCRLAYTSDRYSIGASQSYTCGAVTQQSFTQTINKGFYQLSWEGGTEVFLGEFDVTIPGYSELNVFLSLNWNGI